MGSSIELIAHNVGLIAWIKCGIWKSELEDGISDLKYVPCMFGGIGWSRVLKGWSRLDTLLGDIIWLICNQLYKLILNSTLAEGLLVCRNRTRMKWDLMVILAGYQYFSNSLFWDFWWNYLTLPQLTKCSIHPNVTWSVDANLRNGESAFPSTRWNR